MLAVNLLFLVAASGAAIEAAEIKCEKVDRFDTFKNCCYLNGTTAISSVDFNVAGLENADVDAILFNGNRKIKFLPLKFHKKFPNLATFLAKHASVKEISASNFEGLSNLKLLDLRENQIKSIPDYCFEGLIKVNTILLKDNKIATMNGVAFANLPRLVIADLRGNDCIDKEFSTERTQNIFRHKISRNCASADASRREIKCSALNYCGDIIKEKLLKYYIKTSGCCKLDYGTHVDSPDYSFAANASYSNLEMIHISRQQNVEFLPVSVHEAFPNLKIYYVIHTPIQKISKKNFEKMFSLRLLWLVRNLIEVIKSDTFEDLISLEFITIARQRLTAMNGQALENLPQIKYLILNHNFCIDKAFLGDKKSAVELISSNCGFEEVDSMEVACEKYQDYENYDYCLMNERTAINATNFIVADLKDEEVEGIIFDRNEKIEYLPVKIYLQFPNLDVYNASRCSIKQVSKENFESLRRLKSIELSSNKIQKISGVTFKGLKSLLHVNLNANQIKSINGRTFDQIPLLTSVDLRSNECIDDMLNEGQSIKNFTRKIIQNCAFTETGEREFEKVFDIECGVGRGGTGYVVGGNETKRGQWPFMAALIYAPKNQFFCGGNIITASHVLTAAHCVQNKAKQNQLEASEIAVLLGRYNISLRAELGSEIRGVKEIIVHPSWNPRYVKFEGDIAVLEMDRAVQFSEFVQPVCLTVEPEISQREAGFVVGWGKSEASALHETVPREALISSVTTDVCFAQDFKLGTIFSQGMFCAGGDGAGPCNGDSGGGFFVRYHGLWTLRGVVSSGSFKADGGCDPGRYALFSNVLDYTSWINDVAKKNLSQFKQEPPKMTKLQAVENWT